MALKMKQSAAVTCFMPNLQMFISGISFFFSWDMKCALVHLGGKKNKKKVGVSVEKLFIINLSVAAPRKKALPGFELVGEEVEAREMVINLSLLVAVCWNAP